MFISCAIHEVVDRKVSKNISAAAYNLKLKELYFEDQSLRRVLSVLDYQCEGNSKFSKMDVHRLMFNAVIHREDSLRSLKFLELIDLYGYPDENINSENIAFYTIFVHSPTSLHARIDSTLSNSSISKQEYDAIKWHLNGRQGMPIFINGMTYFTDKEIFDFYNK
jgi:hypothetical protein